MDQGTGSRAPLADLTTKQHEGRLRVCGLPPRVLLVANTSWYLYNFRRNWIGELRTHGCCVSVAAPMDRYTPLLERLVDAFYAWPVDRAGLNPVREFRAWTRLIEIYRHVQPALVHHFTIKPILYGTAAAKLVGCPAVVNSVTGLGHLFITDRRARKLLRKLIALWYCYSLTRRNVRAVFQNEDDLKLLARCAPRLRSAAVLTAGSGVDLERFRPTPVLDHDGGGRMVLFVGRLIAEKGVREFVRAAEDVWRQLPDARFVICGESDPGNPSSIGTDELAEWQRAGIELLGHVDTIERQYAQADVVVLPSYREGTPRTLLEAAAAGKPVVASDVPGCREVVRHGTTGLLVPPGDHHALARAIHELLVNPARRRQMGATARQWVAERFDERQVFAQQLRLYRELHTFGYPPRPQRVPLEQGVFVFSLDFELAWGTRGRPVAQHIAPFLDGTRAAVGKLLDLLARYEIPATWAFVGGMLLECADGRLHPWLSEAGLHDIPPGNHQTEPHWYAGDIVEQIRRCPIGQELACHTLTHPVIGPDRESRERLDWELGRFSELCRQVGSPEPSSFIYPRGRIAHTDVVARHGYLTIRGPESKWFERLPGERLRAALRLLDAQLALPPVVDLPTLLPDGIWCIPSSQFYAPFLRVGRWVSVKARVRKAICGLRRAARRRAVFHLWTHPFNLGLGTDELLWGLDKIFGEVDRLRSVGTLQVLSMGALAKKLHAQLDGEKNNSD